VPQRGSAQRRPLTGITDLFATGDGHLWILEARERPGPTIRGFSLWRAQITFFRSKTSLSTRLHRVSEASGLCWSEAGTAEALRAPTWMLQHRARMHRKRIGVFDETPMRNIIRTVYSGGFLIRLVRGIAVAPKAPSRRAHARR
jgi:hypothetical protein